MEEFTPAQLYMELDQLYIDLYKTEKQLEEILFTINFIEQLISRTN